MEILQPMYVAALRGFGPRLRLSNGGDRDYARPNSSGFHCRALRDTECDAAHGPSPAPPERE
jgi:hypothetical protein